MPVKKKPSSYPNPPLDLDEFDEDNDLELSESAPSFNIKTNQPLWFIATFIGVGLIVFFFGYYNVLGQINLSNSGQKNNNASYDNQQAAALYVELQTSDTDEDTLTDYEELYLYGTSPYLADSDSDGTDDVDEINATTDPNCPAGQICGRPTNTNSTGNSNSNQSITNSNELSVDGLRTALENSGASANVIENLEDDELLDAYSDLMAGEQIDITNSQTATNQSISITDLQNLSATEIRYFLELGGADPSTLAGMDDDTLVSIFRNALEQI